MWPLKSVQRAKPAGRLILFVLDALEECNDRQSVVNSMSAQSDEVSLSCSITINIFYGLLAQIASAWLFHRSILLLLAVLLMPEVHFVIIQTVAPEVCRRAKRRLKEIVHDIPQTSRIRHDSCLLLDSHIRM